MFISPISAVIPSSAETCLEELNYINLRLTDIINKLNNFVISSNTIKINELALKNIIKEISSCKTAFKKFDLLRKVNILQIIENKLLIARDSICFLNSIIFQDNLFCQNNGEQNTANDAGDINNIQSLPNELLDQIFSLTPFSVRLRLRMVSKSWRTVVDNTRLKGIIIIPQKQDNSVIINLNYFKGNLLFSDVLNIISSYKEQIRWYEKNNVDSLEEYIKNILLKANQSESIELAEIISNHNSLKESQKSSQCIIF